MIEPVSTNVLCNDIEKKRRYTTRMNNDPKIRDEGTAPVQSLGSHHQSLAKTADDSGLLGKTTPSVRTPHARQVPTHPASR